MKFEIHYDEHIERVVVIEAESIEDAEEMIDDLDHSQSAIIDTTYEVWAIRELPKNQNHMQTEYNAKCQTNLRFKVHQQ